MLCLYHLILDQVCLAGGVYSATSGETQVGEPLRFLTFEEGKMVPQFECVLFKIVHWKLNPQCNIVGEHSRYEGPKLTNGLMLL